MTARFIGANAGDRNFAGGRGGRSAFALRNQLHNSRNSFASLVIRFWDSIASENIKSLPSAPALLSSSKPRIAAAFPIFSFAADCSRMVSTTARQTASRSVWCASAGKGTSTNRNSGSLNILASRTLGRIA